MCTKKSCCVVLGGVVFLLALLIGNLLNKLDYFKDIKPLNEDKCKTIDTPLAVEDLEIFKEKYLVGGLDDKLTLHELSGIDAAQNGGLIAWRLDDLEKSQHLVELVKFPKGIRFQAHGIYLEKETYTLFVINHAYKFGGERVEVFRLSEKKNKVVATYMRSIKFSDPNLLGVLNDVTVVGDYLYLTQYMPFADTMEGRDHSGSATLKRTVASMFSKFGTIRKCKNTRADNQVTEEAECVQQVKGLIGMGNGITTDGFKKLWTVDNQAKNVLEFDVDYTSGSLKFNQTIDVQSASDNIHYQESTGNVMVSKIGRVIEFISHNDAIRAGKPSKPINGGASELVFKDGKFIEKKELVYQSKISGVSVAITWGKGANRKVFMGSWHDPKLAICTGV